MRMTVLLACKLYKNVYQRKNTPEEITRETEHQSLLQQLKGKENQQNYQENTEYITLSARTNKGPNVSTTCSIPANQDKQIIRIQ